MEIDLNAEPGRLDTDGILVRTLRASDLDAIAAIDERIVGRSRSRYYEIKVRDALVPGALKVSLVAECDGSVAGFLLASLYYGEFGMPEPSAVLDTIAVAPDRRGRKLGKALLRQLVTNLRGLGIEKIRTEVDWDQFELLAFLAHGGFRLAPRICLELDLSSR
jgi:predicted N-acetyltransferase YhbS